MILRVVQKGERYNLLKERIVSIFWLRNVLKQCREVVVENKRCLIPKQSFELMFENISMRKCNWAYLLTLG